MRELITSPNFSGYVSRIDLAYTVKKYGYSARLSRAQRGMLNRIDGRGDDRR